MKYTILTHFIRKFKTYQKFEREIIYETLDAIKTYLENGEFSYGLRIKKLLPGIYEARIDLRLRITYFRKKDE